MTQLWRDLRAKNVGGSEISALFGESPYLTKFKLWQIKAGVMPPDDLDADERIQAGNFLEAGIIQWANKKWAANFRCPNIYVEHKAVDGMGCTPDAIWNGERNENNILAQVKLVDGLEFRNKWQAERDVITAAPLHIILQVQHEMECIQIEEAWLIVCVGGNRLYRMIIKADPEVAKILRGNVAEFWISIELNNPPPPDFTRDGETIKELRKKLPVVEELEIDEDHAYRLFKKRLALAKKAKTAGDQLETVTAEIEHLIGNAQNVICRGLRVKRHKNGFLRIESFEPIKFYQKRRKAS